MPRPRTPSGENGRLVPKKTEKGWILRSRVRDWSGNIHDVAATGRTEAEVVKKWHEKKAAIIFSGNDVLNGSTPIKEAARIWQDLYLETADLAVGTKQRYREAIKKVIVPGLGDVLLNELSPARVARFMQSVPASRRHARTVLSQICDFAVVEEALSRNPVKDSPTPKTRTSSKPAQALDRATLVAVKAAIEAWEQSVTGGAKKRWLPLRDIVLMQLACGTRIGETLALRWCDVDLEHGMAHIALSIKEDESGKQVLGPTKGRNSRDVTLPPSCVAMLARRLAAAADQSNEDLQSSQQPIFASRAGTHLWVNNVTRAWREARAMGTVDLSDVRLHQLRKTLGTAVVDALGLESGGKVLGHEDLRTTSKYYWDKSAHVPDTRAISERLLDAWTAADESEPPSDAQTA